MPASEDTDLQDDKRFLAIQSQVEDAFEKLTFKFQFDGLDWGEAVDLVAERFTKLVQSAGGPIFDEEGYISPTQTCNEAEITLCFGWNENRRKLLARIRNWIELARAVKARRLLLDGSFVTAKEHPGDVDAVVLLPVDFRLQLQAGNSEALELAKVFLSREPKELFAAEDEEDWWEWFEFFSRTRERTGRRKGLIEVTL